MRPARCYVTPVGALGWSVRFHDLSFDYVGRLDDVRGSRLKKGLLTQNLPLARRRKLAQLADRRVDIRRPVAGLIVGLRQAVKEQ